MMQISENEAFSACRVLFGNDLQISRDFLRYLQPAGAQSAFRQMAKKTHPDKHHNAPAGFKLRQSQLFQDVNQAHKLLQNYLRQRDLCTTPAAQYPQYRGRPASHRSEPRPRPFSATGKIPARPLQFGQYLYYRGLISFRTLACALVWQRQQRPVLGQVAQRWGWLDADGVRQILDCRILGRFGERAEHLGLLNGLQVRALLLHQRTRQHKIGVYFVEQGIFSEADLEHLLACLAAHNQQYRHGFSHQPYYYHH